MTPTGSPGNTTDDVVAVDMSKSVAPHNTIKSDAVQPHDSSATPDETGSPAGGAADRNGSGTLALGRYVFKSAETDEEFEAVHRLNHQTFVEEIAQHTDPGTGFLVDKFHDKNHYFIAKRDGDVVGMVAVHCQPPFSIANRLPDPGTIDRLEGKPLEIRLLAVRPGERHSLVFAGFVWTLYNYAIKHGFKHLLISGVSDKVRLYERLGFKPLGPAIQQGEAEFVPMALDPQSLPPEVHAREPMWRGKMARDAEGECPATPSDSEESRLRYDFDQPTDAPVSPPVSFLPGPVQIDSHVRDAFARPPISHRDDPFINRFERVRRILSEMVGGLKTAMMPGSGTLANDIIAATLAADPRMKRGLMVVNGEFGHRLVGQARRFGLDIQVQEHEWGDPWDFTRIAEALRADPAINWFWGVHLESSTGRVNDIVRVRDCITSIGRPVRICMDCVSSLGAVPIDARGFGFVSGASGKSVGSYAGVALVFANPDSLEGIAFDRIPNYYDLNAALRTDGPRFTFPSPLLLALDSALDRYATTESREIAFQHYAELGEYVRGELRRIGLSPLVEDEGAAPVITTFQTPNDMECAEFLDICRSWGYELSGLSGYLAERKWAQIATMGTINQSQCRPFFVRLRRWIRGLS